MQKLLDTLTGLALAVLIYAAKLISAVMDRLDPPKDPPGPPAAS